MNKVRDAKFLSADPLKCVCDLVENEGGRAEAKRQCEVIVVLLVAVDTKEGPVLWSHRAKTEGVANVNLCQQCAPPQVQNHVNSVIDGDVL